MTKEQVSWSIGKYISHLIESNGNELLTKVNNE